MRIEREVVIQNRGRREVREELVNLFLSENPGTGTGENCSHYKYFVDTLENGNRVFLKRPARLNKGFDFEVHIENVSFSALRRQTMPSHRNIYEDLQNKMRLDPIAFVAVREFITRIYNCEEVSDEELRAINFNIGHSTEIVLKAIKWLFIEQDITYWNWSGRSKLFRYLSELF